MSRADWAREEGYQPRYNWPLLKSDLEINLLKRDTSRIFHDMMDQAMLQNGQKYGDIAKAYPDKVDAVECLKDRLHKYEYDGNVRWLVDVANFAMLEFVHPRHERAYLGPDLSIGRVVPGVAQHTERSNEELTMAPVQARYARSGD